MDMKPMLVSEVIAKAEAELTAKEYSTHSKSALMITFRCFQDYACKCGELYYSSELNESFFSEFCARNSTKHPDQPWTKDTITRKRGALKRLEWIYKYGTIVKHGTKMSPPLPSHYSDIVSMFEAWQVKRNYAKNSKKASARTIRAFLDFIIGNDVGAVDRITADHISNFILTLRGHAGATLQGDLGRLRVFFRFLYLEELTPKNLADFVPAFHRGAQKLESNIWSQEELSKVLGSIDRNNGTGKRDYAAILLAADLGMRNSDIVALKLSDIKWELPCFIEFNQTKTKNVMTLPLPEHVGLAIIDYLKYGRPTTECQNLFVQHIPPYGEVTRFSSNFRNRVAAAGIERKNNRKYGLHSLRHTIATKMLKNGVQFDKIVPFLGHADENTLHVYLNYDIENLRQCALSFEQEVAK